MKLKLPHEFNIYQQFRQNSGFFPETKHIISKKTIEWSCKQQQNHLFYLLYHIYIFSLVVVQRNKTNKIYFSICVYKFTYYTLAIDKDAHMLNG